MKSYPALLICLSILIVLSACGPAAAPTAPPTPTPPPVQVGSMLLNSCLANGVRALCGTLSVFEDRDAGSGRKIDLRVAVVPARSKDTQSDPIFVLAGGPGGAAVDNASVVNSHFGMLNLSRDVVLVDQRGTGGSNPLVCPEIEPEESNEAFAQRCLAALPGDPRFYTTALAMDDVDEVRAALGYDQINLYGISYGVTAAQIYMNRHGEHLRSVILDHGSLLDVAFSDAMPGNSQLALERVFARCAADPACAQAYPNLEAEFAALLPQVETPISTGLADSAGNPVRIDRHAFSAAVHHLLYTARDAARLPNVIHRAAQGAWDDLAAAYLESQGPADGYRYAMPRVIWCFEDWGRSSSEGMYTLSAGSYYLETGLAGLAQLQACALLPDPGESAHHGPAQPSSVPVLILSGQADPQNPPENMAGALELWPNARLLVEPGQGHAYENNTCRTSLMTKFVNQGSAAGLDESCLAEVLLPKFIIP